MLLRSHADNTALCRPNGSYVIADHNGLKPEVVRGPVVTEVRSTYSTWAQLVTRCTHIDAPWTPLRFLLWCSASFMTPSTCASNI